MVNTDGTMYAEGEVRTVVNDVITSDTLYLYHSDNFYSPIVLGTTTQDEALLPGPIIPEPRPSDRATAGRPNHGCALCSGAALRGAS